MTCRTLRSRQCHIRAQEGSETKTTRNYETSPGSCRRLSGNFRRKIFSFKSRTSSRAPCGPRYLSRYSDLLRAGTSGDRIPVVDEIFCDCLYRPWSPPSLLYNGYRVFPGGKAAGAWRWPSPPSSAAVKERVELYPCLPYGLLWPLLRWNVSVAEYVYTRPFPSMVDIFHLSSVSLSCVESRS